jgi:predicted nucleotidyltransferase
MTLLMVSVMLIIELLIMKGMYHSKKINWAIITICLVIGIFSWFGIREQISVGDKEFVKGMIPHHAAAVLMSEKAKLTDPELIELQKNILETQAKEIEFMKRKLKEFQNK